MILVQKKKNMFVFIIIHSNIGYSTTLVRVRYGKLQY